MHGSHRISLGCEGSLTRQQSTSGFRRLRSRVRLAKRETFPKLDQVSATTSREFPNLQSVACAHEP